MPAKTRRRNGLVSRSAALLLAVGALVALFVGAPLAAGSAWATQGSVPSLVAAYAADPAGLVARLHDLFGPNAKGEGLDFGDDTTAGEIDRAFTWRDDFLAGMTDSSPIKLVNEWTTVISVGDRPVGVATIWINPATDRPELADFTEDGALGTAFTAIPAQAAVVHDTAHSAWFALTGTTLAVLAPGTSGVASDATLATYQQRLVDEAQRPPIAPAAVDQGAINSIIVVVIALVVVVALVILAGRRSIRAMDAETQATAKAQDSAAD